MTLRVAPITIGDARAFVQRHHSHHNAPVGGLLAVSSRAPWRTVTASDFTVPAPVVEGYVCTLCDAFAPRHLTLTHAAGCRGRTAP